MNKDELYKELISKYGDKQLIIAIEELSEFAKELCKYLRGKLDKSNLLEEYVDAMIMMEQMKILFELKDEDIQKFKNWKLTRLEERMKKNQL